MHAYLGCPRQRPKGSQRHPSWRVLGLILISCSINKDQLTRAKRSIDPSCSWETTTASSAAYHLTLVASWPPHAIYRAGKGAKVLKKLLLHKSIEEQDDIDYTVHCLTSFALHSACIRVARRTMSHSPTHIFAWCMCRPSEASHVTHG